MHLIRDLVTVQIAAEIQRLDREVRQNADVRPTSRIERIGGGAQEPVGPV